MAEQLLSFVKSLVTLPPQEETKLRNHAKESHIKKGRFYISEGQIPNKFAFVNQGLFRYMYRDHKGNEYTKNFITEGQFITSYSAMASQSPSKMYIEALEDSSLTELHYSDWLQLKNGDPCWNAFLVVVLEKAFAIKEQRERDLLLLDAQQRYQLFKKEYGTLESRIKQHLIASYLGISPISLSRLKKIRDLNIC